MDALADLAFQFEAAATPAAVQAAAGRPGRARSRSMIAAHRHPPLPPLPDQQLDLRALCRALGLYPTAIPATTGYRRRIRLGVGGPSSLANVKPLEMAGTSDGVQRRWVIGRHDGRPVTLEAVSAGVLGPDPRRDADVIERVYIAASHLDADRYQAPCFPPVVPLDGISPHTLDTEVAAFVDDLRRELERRVIAGAAKRGAVLVDGSIRDRSMYRIGSHDSPPSVSRPTEHRSSCSRPRHGHDR